MPRALPCLHGAAVSSDLPPQQRRAVLDALRMRDASGASPTRLLFVAPERLANENFRKRLAKTPLALLAIDEAHCISEWGHNFRPDYLKLTRFANELKIPRVLCLTATATPRVANDICRHFQIQPQDHHQLTFYRSI